MIGLDTTALIDISKSNKEILDLINNLDEDICSTIINHQEVMFGLDLDDSTYAEEEGFFDDFFNGIFVFHLEIPSSKEASKIKWQLRKNGMVIDEMDCSIAGILLINGVNKIITRNVKHFENISGLEVIPY